MTSSPEASAPGVRELILVRHGVTDWNEAGRLMGRRPIPMNDRGRVQARAAALALGARPVGAVVASPQLRTQETAAIVAEAHGLSVASDEALAEVWLGRWQDLSRAELRDDPDLAHYGRDPLHECDAIESATSVRSRILAFLDRLRAATGPHTVVAVSHGDPLRIMLAELLGMPLAAYRRLVVDPGSISIVRFGRRQPVQVRVINWLPEVPWRVPETSG
ncbi:histidine phosphatase family protein [Candidatus Binatia bacterium]|nr:histidine phosphatase family protein [Candidatus Binatia bacterium]